MSTSATYRNDIPISNLKLDLYNPRLPKSKQGKDEKTVIEYLLLEAATTELMESIGENDFFDGEMLLVVSDESANGKYVVVEGNRRLTAVLLLSNPELTTVRKSLVKEIADNSKYKLTELPCLLFPSRNDVQKYLGFVHITGKKTWRMLEKARYLYEISINDSFKNVPFQQKCKDIARTIGSKYPYVRKILISYELYKIVEDENFYQIDDLSDSNFYLNYFADGLLKDNIREFIGVDMLSEKPLENINHKQFKELCLWWFKKTEGVSRVLGDSDGMGKLNAVLGNEIALKAFREGVTISQAFEMTDDIDIQFRDKIKDALDAMEQADRLSNKVKDYYNELYDDLKTIRQIAMKIKDFKERKENGGDDF